MRFKSFILIQAALLVVVLRPVRLEAAIDKDVIEAFEALGITLDANIASRLAAEAFLKAADPHARLLSDEERRELAEKKAEAVVEEWPEGIRYVKIGRLDSAAGMNVAAWILEGARPGSGGVLLDLRGAAGTWLEAVDAIASLFAVGDGGLLYEVRSAGGTVVETHRTAGEARLPPGAAVVALVDAGTRESAELLAALLKGRANVLVLGERTAGDAGIREAVRLPCREWLLVRTRDVVPPAGREYDGCGVLPDVIATNSPTVVVPGSSVEDAERIRGKVRQPSGWIELTRKAGGDAVLCRAIDILLGLKRLGLFALPSAEDSQVR